MKSGRTRRTGRNLIVVGLLLSAVFLTWLVVFVPGISIPLDGFRQPLEAAATRALGREVRIAGALALKPGIGPTFVAHNVHIAGSPGAGDLLRAGRITVQLAPAALLRGSLRSRRLLIEDAGIELDATTAMDGGEANAGIHYRLLSAGAGLLAQQPDLQAVDLRRVVLNIRDDSAGPTWPLELGDVSVRTRPAQALELILRGRFQQQPCTIALTGGRLVDLLEQTTPWPVQGKVNIADARLMFDGNLEMTHQALAMTYELQVGWPAEFAHLAALIGDKPLAGQLSLGTEQGIPSVNGELQLPTLETVLHISTAAGSAGMPLTVNIADVSFRGQLVVADDDPETGIELALSATDASADRILEILTGTSAIRGHIGHINLQTRLTDSGETAMAKRVAMKLQLDEAILSYGNADGERPVGVSLDELTLTLPAGEAMTVQARGSLLDEPIAVELTGGGLTALLAEDTWPLTLSATGGGAVLDVSGPLSIRGNTATRLHVGLYGQRIGELSTWLGVSPCAATPYTLRGQLVLARDIGRLQFLQINTGRTRLNGELDWSRDEQTGLLQAVLHLEELDPADIEALVPLVRQAASEAAAGTIAIDIPVLPGPIDIVNADIDLDIAHILLKLVEITDVSLAARIREGRLQRSPFHARLGNAGFQGYLDPSTADTGVVFENEDQDSATGGRMDRLFSSAVRWAGTNAVVPLRWIFRKKLAADDPASCRN